MIYPIHESREPTRSQMFLASRSLGCKCFQLAWLHESKNVEAWVSLWKYGKIFSGFISHWATFTGMNEHHLWSWYPFLLNTFMVLQPNFLVQLWPLVHTQCWIITALWCTHSKFYFPLEYLYKSGKTVGSLVFVAPLDLSLCSDATVMTLV